MLKTPYFVARFQVFLYAKFGYKYLQKYPFWQGKIPSVPNEIGFDGE